MESIIKLSTMKLSKQQLSEIKATESFVVPNASVFELPEKVLQFGTGVLLRGLPDYIISEANNEGRFNGRIVMVKSTNSGDTAAFESQDGLYTVCIRGIKNKKEVSTNHIVASVCRVLTASSEWDEVLQCAANPDMQLIISNTTEVGIVLTKDNVHAAPPTSFPGKLLAFLYQRFKVFKGDVSKGMVIVPTELIPDNADKLLSILLEMAHQNGLEITFIDWLENANHFCNSLVDRIVPGKFNKEEETLVSAALGYEDDLMIMSEYYVLWAIQSSSEKVKEILSFANENNGVLIAPNINKFRNLKLKLLNGSHTFTCGLAVLAGFANVKEAMSNTVFSQYITQLMNDGIVPALLSDDIDEAEAQSFANSVLDRYGNPFIDHKWLSICVQYSAKMNMRCLPQILEYQQRFSEIHPAMSLGLAAHLLFMKVHLQEDGTYAGSYQNQPYLVTDANAAIFAAAWEKQDFSSVVTSLLGNQALWSIDLLQLSGLAEATISCLNLLTEKGALATMDIFNKQKSVFTDAS